MSTHVISFTVPDSEDVTAINDLAESYGYTDTIPDPEQADTAVPAQIPNPMSRWDFVKQAIGRDSLNRVLAVRANRAHAELATQVGTAAETLAAACSVS